MSSRGTRSSRCSYVCIAAALVGGAVTAGCGSSTASPQRIKAEREEKARADAEARAAAGATAPAGGTPSTSSARPAARPVSSDELREWLTALVATSGSSGGIAAVRFGDEPPLIVTEGTADTASGTPLAVDSAFPVGAVTESFTAALTLALAAEGLLALNDPLDLWLDWPGADDVTTRHLLEHQAGFALFGTAHDTEPIFADLARRDGRRYSTDEVLAAARVLPPTGVPGAEIRHNPLDYIVLGTVLESAAVLPFGVLLADRITVPLGLAATWYPPSGPAGPSPQPGAAGTTGTTGTTGTSQPASGSVGADARRTHDSLIGPAGAMVSDVPDLLAWADAVFRAKDLGGVSLKPMTEAASRRGLSHGVVGIDASGACWPDICPGGATYERLGLFGDAPGATVRVVHDPRLDVTLVVYLPRHGIVLDAEITTLLDSLG